jgi:hypothetical protein
VTTTGTAPVIISDSSVTARTPGMQAPGHGLFSHLSPMTHDSVVVRNQPQQVTNQKARWTYAPTLLRP